MKWIHNLLKGASLTTALFIFQACYGMPPDWDEPGEAPMSFSLVSSERGDPLQGIHILGKIYEQEQYRDLGTTAADGTCRVSIPFKKNQQGPYLRFEDPEHHFADQDTSLADLRDRVIEIGLKDAE
jgi:hypothetical protein